MIYELYDAVNTLVFVALVYCFESCFLIRRAALSFRSIVLSVVIWFFTELIICRVFDENFILKVIMTIGICSICSALLFKDRFQSILLTSVLAYSISLFFDYLIYTISLLFIDYIPVGNINGSITAICLGTISQLLFLFTIMIIRIGIKDRMIESILPGMWYKFSALPAFSLLVIVAFTVSFKDDYEGNHRIFFVFLAMLLLAINLYAFHLFLSEIKTSYEITRMRMNDAYAEELSNLYKQICDRQNQITADSHEYKNKIALIYKLIEDEDYKSLADFVNREHVQIEKNENVVDTGNPIITAIFNTKYKEAVDNDIRVRFDIGNLSSVNMNEEDLVIILFNLLNNAIEGCMKCQAGRRLINIKMTADSDFFIFVNNTYEGDVCFADGSYKSTKGDLMTHGFGIDNLKRVIANRKGFIYFKTTENVFSVRVMIPINK